MNLQQIDHVALTCHSPATTMAWYIRVLGFEHAFAGQWNGVPLILRLGTTSIALFPSGGASHALSDVRFDHLAFRTGTYTDFEQAQVSLRGHDVPFRFQDHEICHSIYFVDPDDHKLEITTYDLAAPPAKASN